MPRCNFIQCGKDFPPDPNNPKKLYCDRKCSARANALATKGQRGKKHHPRTCGRRGNTGIRRDLA